MQNNKKNVIERLVIQSKKIESSLDDNALQIIGDGSYSNLNWEQYCQRKTQITLLKEQQYIDPDQLKKLEENEDQNKQKKWLFSIIRPEEPKKIIWDLIGMSFIFIQMITIPLILTFSIESDQGFSVFSHIMDYYFIADIILQFQTGYYRKGNYISSRKSIILNYLKCWFWLDLISSFPYDDIISLTINEEQNQQDIQRNTQIIKIMRVIRFVKVIRLMRALKLKKIINQIEDSLLLDKTLTSFIQFLKICLIILCLSHWLACIWNAIRLIQENNKMNWYDQYVIQYDQQLDNDITKWYNQYIAGIYFRKYSITTMITIGYGDISPKNTNERLFGIFVMILASGVFGYVMNSIVLMFQNTNESLEDLLNKNNSAIQYMRQKQIVKQLQSRIKNYLEWLAEDEQLQKSYAQNTLNKLSLPLKNQLTQLVHGNMMTTIKFLRKNFSTLLLKKLAFVFQEEIYNPEDYIINHNDPINDQTSLYYILNGRVFICFPKNRGFIEIKELTKKNYFGEISFFANVPRCASVKARNFINIFRLTRKSFLEQCEVEDFEKFFSIKFNIEFEQDYSDLKIQCYTCNAYNHTAKSCPNIHYHINKYERINIIDKYNEQLKTQINEKRQLRSKISTFKLYNDIKNKQAIKQITSDHYNLEKYTKQYKQLRNNKIIIKDSFKTDSIKEYSNFVPYSNLASIARVQNYNAELYAENVRQLKEQQKKSKLKSKFVQFLQNKNEKRTSQQSQGSNKFSKLIFDITKLKNQQQQQQSQLSIVQAQTQQQQQQSVNSPESFTKLSASPQSERNKKLLRSATMRRQNNNRTDIQNRLKRMPRKTYLGEICNFGSNCQQKEQQQNQNQQQYFIQEKQQSPKIEIFDAIPEDALESPVQLLKESKEIKQSFRPFKLFKSMESTSIESQYHDLYYTREIKRSISFDENKPKELNETDKFTKPFLENMIYLVINYKIQSCK